MTKVDKFCYHYQKLDSYPDETCQKIFIAFYFSACNIPEAPNVDLDSCKHASTKIGSAQHKVGPFICTAFIICRVAHLPHHQCKHTTANLDIRLVVDSLSE